jgi:hypothetical protein
VSQLRGGDDLRKRLKSLKLAFKPIGRKWGTKTVQNYRPSVPVKTGKLRKSFRVTSATQTRARVGGSFVAYFIDAGTKPHIIKPKSHGFLTFQAGGRTVFARQVHHRGFRARPFRARGARAALADTPMRDELTNAWNKAV